MRNFKPIKFNLENDTKQSFLVFFVAFLLIAFLPLLINTGAIGPLTIFLFIYGLKQVDRLLKAHASLNQKILIEKLPNGAYAIFDYYDLCRVNHKEYYSAEQALSDLRNSNPNCFYEVKNSKSMEN